MTKVEKWEHLCPLVKSDMNKAISDSLENNEVIDCIVLKNIFAFRWVLLFCAKSLTKSLKFEFFLFFT